MSAPTRMLCGHDVEAADIVRPGDVLYPEQHADNYDDYVEPEVYGQPLHLTGGCAEGT